MEKSLYFEYTEQWFPNLVIEIAEKLNEKRTNALTYLYRATRCRVIPHLAWNTLATFS